MDFFRWLADAPARVWRAVFRQGNLRLWAIILGAPPLCGMVIWILDLLARLAVAADPVRVELALAIADIGKLLTLIIGVIVVALSTVRVRATIPAGSLDVGGSPDLPFGGETQAPADPPSRWDRRRSEREPRARGQLSPHERIEP